MTERPPAPPEGELIKAALKTSPFSQRQAALRAGISETRWRQIVSGYQAVGGEKVPFRSRDETLARMAHVVGVSPGDLTEVGRPDAAAALLAIEADKPDQDTAAALQAGSQIRVDERWYMLEALLRQARNGLSRAEYSTLVDRINVFFAQTPDWQPPDPLPVPGEAPEDPEGAESR
ncbi:helix-turn-helix domain-containing protein [Streptomyces sp. NBC_01190]|uniref:helix-turn-helix domain-containing protein n=1 Tax=Streptomyces sp. NBC_01190 TaxID=2903767 RepID=UPI00386BBF59|nr:helix-turn-helix domain-containing protein [Streptomyces sp. NBC_01190]